MYKVNVSKVGSTFRGEARYGSIVSFCAKTPVEAAKLIAKDIELATGKNFIVIAGENTRQFFVEEADLLKHKGQSILFHKLFNK